ncbi:MAG: zinc ribbon domain-containing protein [Treponema sp.]|jgi:putative FmdB family regulatory protein|nr:zinc ribbon domain-containing protein [Treponema sp.]
MPTYEYECKTCGHSFEAFQSMREEPLKECPQCGKEVRRLINGGSGIIFKGSGFYVTDKKGGSGAASNAVSAGPESSNKPSSESPGTSSSTPAAKTPAESAPSSGSAAPVPTGS